MNTRVRKYGLALALGLALPLLATHKVFAAAPTDVAAPPDVGGFGAPTTVTSFLPIFNSLSNQDIEAYNILFTPLVWPSPTIGMDTQLSLASKISYSDNDKIVTITLKHRFWSDGRPVTSDDVLYTLKLIRKLGTSYVLYGFGQMPSIIKKATAPDAHTVRLLLKHSVNPTWFTLNALAQINPVPKQVWDKYSTTYISGHETSPKLTSVIDGPYKLASFESGRQAVFVENATYGGPATSVKKFTLTFFPSWEQQFEALKTGQIQIGQVPTILYQARAMVSKLQSYKQPNGQKSFYPFEFKMVWLNFTNPDVAFFKNREVRRALQLAISQQYIIDSVYHGNGAASFSAVPPRPDTYLSPEIKRLNAHPNEVYSPATAEKLLSAQGWNPSASGIREKNGKPLAFTMSYMSGDAAQKQIALILQEEWQKVGVEVHLHREPENLLLSQLHPNGKWQAIMLLWSYAPMFYPSGDGIFNTGGGANFGAFSDPVLDKAIAASTTKAGLKGLWAYQDRLFHDLPVLFLPVPGYLVKSSTCLTNLETYLNPTAYLAPQALGIAPSCAQ
ncbi:peptide ABC transporter substrate-binding protein [Acidihalobacter ferrooxydans]|uniref:Solute-binding protein family 5 domain-containing protein n=1 Tax=Acidihalobacter ferrooxydans TaxID=1765967 RepID=A0A1P8UJY2_9GAMM|nr:peptide ABC transporter substrate-binding protein [Acidihalobacter ferrooxydans]APZ44146.1 hypothetical protein BW247_14455 [Acidihalobacter ferrooxydans]